MTQTTKPASPKSLDPPEPEGFSADYRKSSDVVARLRVIQVALARDAALLAFMSEHPDHYDTLEDGRAVSRHVRALKVLAELELRDLRLGGRPGPGPGSPEMRQVLSLLVDKIIQVAHDVLGTDTATQLERRFHHALDADPHVPWP